MGAGHTLETVMTPPDRRTVYLDHAATTPMLPAAIEAMAQHLARTGNASSLHGSGRCARRTVEEAREQLGGSASVYLDGGRAEQGQASTIVDLTGATPRILREGAVPTGDVADVLGVTAESLSAQ